MLYTNGKSLPPTLPFPPPSFLQIHYFCVFCPTVSIKHIKLRWDEAFPFVFRMGKATQYVEYIPKSQPMCYGQALPPLPGVPQVHQATQLSHVHRGPMQAL